VPAPERGKHTRWSTFLRAHWGAIGATDFFRVEVLALSGLVRAACVQPNPGRWGGQNGGAAPPAQGTTNAALSGAPPTAADLSKLLSQPLPALGVNVSASGAKAPLPAAGTGSSHIPALTGG
jgi:hypothetical protein